MYRVIGLILAFGAVVLAACDGADATGFAPAGMAQGQPTFLYAFTDN